MSHFVAMEAGYQHEGDGDIEYMTAAQALSLLLAQARGHGNLINLQVSLIIIYLLSLF